MLAFGAGSPPLNVACGMRRSGLRQARQHDRAVVAIERRLIEWARVLVRPVHAHGYFRERAVVERVQQRVDDAERIDLVLARQLRPPLCGAKERHLAHAAFVAELHA
jgi:hypothetical protein